MKYTDKDGICSAPQFGINLVFGEPNTRTCESQRTPTAPWEGYCGAQALFFVAKIEVTA